MSARGRADRKAACVTLVSQTISLYTVGHTLSYFTHVTGVNWMSGFLLVHQQKTGIRGLYGSVTQGMQVNI
jgi:hypothetical protein